MQCRFKMEYRLFTIVIVRYNYNYRDYNSPPSLCEFMTLIKYLFFPLTLCLSSLPSGKSVRAYPSPTYLVGLSIINNIHTTYIHHTSYNIHTSYWYWYWYWYCKTLFIVLFLSYRVFLLNSNQTTFVFITPSFSFCFRFSLFFGLLYYCTKLNKDQRITKVND